LKNSASQRALRLGALCLLCALPATLQARAHHNEAWARDRFASAERMREALNGRPAGDRSRRDYQRVLNAYRGVYFGAPASVKADPSVVAAAETLVEMGRRFEDEKILLEAINQYKFLRREYPGSKYRFDALFTIGEIYKDDLGQADNARLTFQEFLQRYPHSGLADDAQGAISELDQEAQAQKKAEKKLAKSGKTARESAAARSDTPGKELSGEAVGGRTAGLPSVAASGRLPRVTGIRHWSTPDYTRVAIDVEGDTKFASQRIHNPDRIFFDLRDTKLASTLVGKSFDVDDGFLKKIRVAQFERGRTRVVLEVANLSDYNAFLLPNPYRLIIDIHGKHSGGPQPSGSTDSYPVDGSKLDGFLEPAASANTDSPLPIKVNSERKTRAAGSARPVESDVTVWKRDPESTARPVVDSRTPRGGASSALAKNMLPVKKIVEADDDDPSGGARVAWLEPAAGKSSASPLTPLTTGTGKSGGADIESDPVASSDSPIADTAVKGAPRKPSISAKKQKTSTLELDIREAKPTADGERSLIRALGLKIGRIVIDAGHGGHDTGTIGPNGLEEKDLVLEVGKRLGKMLETRLGAEVVYTRQDDTFIPLETRTAIANRERADLFISIHANSSHDPAARGVETYYLNFSSSPEALEVAARENAVSEKSIYELQDLVKKIALKDKIEESREFAGDVQESLHSGLAAKSPAIRDRGVKKAPFIVLIGANMPSILAEISFVSNPTDEHRLQTGEYRQRIAESLYRGIAKYVGGLSGVKVASKLDRPAGQ
jgi:N-acetylmuramoyl-L-alanine amidase